MSDYYTYQKKRKDMGKQCQFVDTEIKHCGYFPQSKDGLTNADYKTRNPNFIMLDNINELSEHIVNTDRVQTSDKGMYHKEGGWPGNVDPTEPQDTQKFKKKIEKDPLFAQSIKELSSTVEKCILQNNQIDMFEEYFQHEQSEHVVENLSSKTLMLFKDDCEICKRAVSEISWYPESVKPTKLAVSYAIMRFQQMPENMPSQAYLWDIQNPNTYDVELKAPSPVTNISYNQKITDTIGGGCYNGLIVCWDQRKGKDPTHISPVDNSHYDPVTHFQWLMSRTGTECVTTSTDGRVMWWDTKKFDQPVEVLNIYENVGDTKTIGGTVLEYNVDAGPSKFLIGTEQGSILTANKKPKKDVDITTRYGLENGRHLGPIYALNRSIQGPKFFLSVGDWSAKIWVEDLKVPIIRTRYHGSYLSDGMWSPTRPGVFFLTRRDGWMDCWDFYYRQNEIAYSHKVSDAPLTCLKLNINSQSGGQQAHVTPTGKLVAVGDQDGTVTVLELCDSLYIPQPREKDIINETFERELRKEKNLETIKKQQEIAKKVVPKDTEAIKQKWDKKKQEMIQEVEQKFQKVLEEAEKNKMDEELADLDSPKNAQKKEDDKELKQQKSIDGKKEEQEQRKEESKEQVDQQQDEKEPSQHDKSVHSHKSKKSEHQDGQKE